MSRMRLFRCTLLLMMLLTVCVLTVPALAEVGAQEVYLSKGPILFVMGKCSQIVSLGVLMRNSHLMPLYDV